MKTAAGIIYSMLLDGDGRGHDFSWDQVVAQSPRESPLWLHLNYADPEVQEWLEHKSGLDAITCEALWAEDTRPRLVPASGGLLITLRGVNCNPGAEPDDMVSLRLWVDSDRIITMRQRPVAAISDLRQMLDQGTGPENTGDFLTMLIERLIDRIAETVSDIEEGVDELEDRLLEKERAALRMQLSSYRRMIIGLRRYIVPQREVLARLYNERAPWVTDILRLRLREAAERMARLVEDLDAARDRAAIVQEELNARLSEQMNQTIYMMSIVATIFLPLGLITGLLGINVGGMPGAENRLAFWIVCFVLAIIAVMQYIFFKRKQIL